MLAARHIRQVMGETDAQSAVFMLVVVHNDMLNESESLVLVTARCHAYYVHRTIGRTPSGLLVSILVLQ